jgi:tetratricopeptide (TPR) repeat protein
VEELSGPLDFENLLDELKRDGPAWIAARGPESQARRELIAATFALEAARAAGWYEWKLIWKPPYMSVGGVSGGYQPFPILYWAPAPLLLEWACELLRHDPTPRPIERWWQLAAVSVAQRSEDAHFLIGDPFIGRGEGMGEIGNPKAEIKHLDHIVTRFPDEPRFMLAQGIARDRYFQDDALTAYTAVANDPDVGGEAMMRLGAMWMRAGKLSEAMTQFDRSEKLTRDPYVVYLARYFRGQLFERQRNRDKAEAAYRSAIAAWPHAQSGTMALASLLFDAGRRADAYALTTAMLTTGRTTLDPWREYVHADDRFWPALIGRLRAEILR